MQGHMQKTKIYKEGGGLWEFTSVIQNGINMN